MPFKLIGSIILLVLVTIFAGVNLDNKCDITFIFYTFKQVPVFMTVIISFSIGLVLMLPFTFGRKNKKSSKEIAQNSQKQQPKEDSKTLFDFKIKRETKPDEKNSDSKKKKSFFGSNKKKESKKSDSEKENDSETGAPV